MSIAAKLREWIPGSAFSKDLVNKGAKAIEDRDEALLWYQERAASLNKAFRLLAQPSSVAVHNHHVVRIQAIATELSLDAGQRATKAMGDD